MTWGRYFANAGRTIWSEPGIRKMAYGGGLGAAYGLGSRDTSMVGGAFMGAMGGAGYSSFRHLGGVRGIYGAMRAAAPGRGGMGGMARRMGTQMGMMGRMSAEHLGRSFSRPIQRIWSGKLPK